MAQEAGPAQQLPAFVLALPSQLCQRPWSGLSLESRLQLTLFAAEASPTVDAVLFCACRKLDHYRPLLHGLGLAS